MLFGKKRIYADAAAATPLSEDARHELLRLLDVYGNAGALHAEGVEAHDELEAARTIVAKAMGAHADEIIFTASGTESNNLALQGTVRPILRGVGEAHAVTLATEHASILEPLRGLEVDGLYTTLLPVDHEGLVSVDAVRDAITDETVLVTVQLVNSEVGTIQPIRAIAKELRRIKKQRTNGLPLYFHCDASQAPLWLEIRVESLGVDLMTLDAQKVMGPKGVGSLYVKRGLTLEPLVWGGSQEKGLRGGTPNVPLAGAYAVALRWAQAVVVNEIEHNTYYVSRMRDLLWEEIQRLIPGSVLNGPRMELRVANNLNISIPGLDAEMAVIAMSAEGIAISTRSACSTGDLEPSHVLASLGVSKEISHSALRITLLPDISEPQVKKIARTLAQIATRYRVGVS